MFIKTTTINDKKILINISDISLIEEPVIENISGCFIKLKGISTFIHATVEYEVLESTLEKALKLLELDNPE